MYNVSCGTVTSHNEIQYNTEGGHPSHHKLYGYQIDKVTDWDQWEYGDLAPHNQTTEMKSTKTEPSVFIIPYTHKWLIH